MTGWMTNFEMIYLDKRKSVMKVHELGVVPFTF